MRLSETLKRLRSLAFKAVAMFKQLTVKRARNAFRRALVFEGLEGRRPLAFSIASSGNSITLTGDASDDGVVISVSSSGHFQHDLALSGNLVSAIDTNGTSAGEQALVASSVSSITITANAGNDTIDASAWTGVGITYTLASRAGDNDNAAFNIAGNILRASNSFDFETKSSYTIRIRSTDQGGLYTEKTFTVTVTDVNEEPTDINITPASILENAGVNASVGTLSSVDPDAT